MADERGRRIFRADLYNKRHIRNLIAQSRAIQSLFDDLSREAARIGEATKFNDPSEPFYWRDHPAAQKQVDELLASVAQQMQLTIEEGNKQEWLLANAKNDEMVKTILSSSNIPKARLAQFTARNLDALEAFQSRKVGGMNLSDRVWALRDNLKGELELALDIGLGEGRSADRLSRDVRQYLKEPNKLFRRVKDKHGVLRLSQSAAAYHPGRGVYRSSYKNALRMTATENNMAYRTADHERWQQIDFVIGIEIQLSNNHPVVDICDELKGVYPKDFKFTGWHPFCRCHAVAKLPSQEEFVKYQQAMIDGEDVSDWKFKGEVTEMPKQWNDWLEENATRIENAKSLPYFLIDNPTTASDYIVNWAEGAKRPLSPIEIAAKRHAQRTPDDVEKIRKRWNSRRLSAIYEARRKGLLPDEVWEAAREIENSIFLGDQDDANKRLMLLEAAIRRHQARTPDMIRKIQDAADERKYGNVYVEQIHEIEKSLGVKRGKRMSHNEANLGNVNPNYVTGNREYHVNCSSCSGVYWLRRMGFNVETLPNNSSNPLVQALSRGETAWDKWIDGKKDYIKTYDWMQNKGYKRMNEKRYMEFIKENATEAGIYELNLGWKGGGGHSTLIEVDNAGNVTLIDQQIVGVKRTLSTYLAAAQGILPTDTRGILRVDNRAFNSHYARIAKVK